MEKAVTNPGPPNLANLTWRLIRAGDLASLVELARACLLVDGGLSFLFEPDVLQIRYFPGAPGSGIGAFAPDNRLVACAAVHTGSSTGAQQASIVGQVRPYLRNRGIGDFLMRWSQEQARLLLAGAAENRRVRQIQTESLTGPAERLYHAHGFEKVFEELAPSLEQPQLPAQVLTLTFILPSVTIPLP